MMTKANYKLLYNIFKNKTIAIDLFYLSQKMRIRVLDELDQKISSKAEIYLIDFYPPVKVRHKLGNELKDYSKKQKYFASSCFIHSKR